MQQEWDGRYAEMRQLWSGRPNGALVAEVSDLAPGRVLDVGCGEGADAVWLARRGWDVTALDVSGVALAWAAEHASEAGVDVRWVHAGLVEAALPAGSFDLVSAQYPALLRTPGFDAEHTLLADYVSPAMIAALLDNGWHLEVDEQRPREVPPGGAGAHHADDLVLRARRLR